MKRTCFAAALFAGALALASCGKTESGNPGRASEQAVAALMAKYPDAANVRWQAKPPYMVASFTLPASRTAEQVGTDLAAWFDNGGEWYMTETDILFTDLPQEVQTAFGASEYAAWNVCGVDRLEREGAETVYVIEVEGTEEERTVKYHLYYSLDGVLIKKVVDASPDYDYGDYIPSKPVSGIENFLQQNYPDARILDIDREGGLTEVEILDGRTCRELLFDDGGNWLYTKTEVRESELPEAVRQALAASEYAAYRIDDIDHYETAAGGEYYRFDLESRNGDVKVDIAPDGTLSVVQPGDGGNGDMVTGSVAEFIRNKYPGAVIRKRDYEDGYLEVEIWHDDREKEVYFNGRDEWVYTEWEVRSRELPQAVSDAIRASEYASYEIDDIDFIETPAAAYYLVELEQGRLKAKLRIDEGGNVL